MTETVIAGEHLRLVSVTSSEMSSMTVGQTASWDVGLRVVSADEANVEVTIEVLGATPESFEMSVAKCAHRWEPHDVCPTGQIGLTSMPVTAGTDAALDQTTADQAPWYRVSVTMIGGQPGSRADLRLHAVAAGDSVSTDGGTGTQELSRTGITVWRQLLVGAVSISVGLALTAHARRRTRQGQADAKTGASP